MLEPIPANSWRIELANRSAEGYVLATWMASLRSAPDFRRMHQTEFHRAAAAPIDRVLERDDTRVWIAVDYGGPIIGWCVATPIPGAPVLHFVYTRKRHASRDLRRTGVATSLLERAGVDTRRPFAYTFRGPDHDRLVAQLPTAMYLDPQEFLR